MATSADSLKQQNVIFGNEYVTSELVSEYQTLQRQLKILETDRRLHTLEAAEAARRQQADLQRLEQENAELKRSLVAARSQSAQRERRDEGKRLQELVAELDSLEAEIRRTREGHLQLDARIREAQRQRRQVGGARGAAVAEHSLQETLVLYEKKLESRSVKYQTTVWQNSKLRESLDHLRADRQKFLRVRSRLQAELESLNRRRNDLTLGATEAYRESEEARRRIKELQEREKLATAEHLQRVKLLYREIDFHDSVGAFVRAKWQTRAPDPELQRLRAELERHHREEGDRRAADDESLQVSFDLMRRRYGAPTLDDMVHHFLRVEDENFSLFRYCTAAQAEVGALTAEVDRLAIEIRREGVERDRLVEGRSEVLTELTVRLAETKADRLRRVERLRVVTEVLETLVMRAAGVCDKIGAIRLGDSVSIVGDVTGGGLLATLGCLEGRVLELLAVRQFLAATTGQPQLPPPRIGAVGDAGGGGGGRRGTTVAQMTGLLHLPEVDEADIEVRSNEADVLMSERPLTKKEIVEKLLNEVTF